MISVIRIPARNIETYLRDPSFNMLIGNGYRPVMHMQVEEAEGRPPEILILMVKDPKSSPWTMRLLAAICAIQAALVVLGAIGLLLR